MKGTHKSSPTPLGDLDPRHSRVRSRHRSSQCPRRFCFPSPSTLRLVFRHGLRPTPRRFRPQRNSYGLSVRSHPSRPPSTPDRNSNSNSGSDSRTTGDVTPRRARHTKGPRSRFSGLPPPVLSGRSLGGLVLCARNREGSVGILPSLRDGGGRGRTGEDKGGRGRTRGGTSVPRGPPVPVG